MPGHNLSDVKLIRALRLFGVRLRELIALLYRTPLASRAVSRTPPRREREQRN
jgi:hypothetical protein